MEQLEAEGDYPATVPLHSLLETLCHLDSCADPIKSAPVGPLHLGNLPKKKVSGVHPCPFYAPHELL